MLGQITAVARNTYTAAIRQPIALVLLLLTLGILALNPAVSAYTLEDDDKLLRDIGLSTVFVAGLFLSAFTAAAALSEEIRRKTVLSVVSKPVHRWTFLVGKYVGALGSVWIAQWIWSLALLFTLRHGVLMTVRDPYHEPVIYFGLGALALAFLLAFAANYFRGAVFASTLTHLLAIILPMAIVPAFLFDSGWTRVPFLEQFDLPLLVALLLVGQALAMLCAIAITAATRVGQMATLSICSLAFVAGLTSEYFLGTLVERSIAARMAYAVLPNLQHLWLGDALLGNLPITLGYFIQTSCYSGLYVVACMAISTLLFQSRDVG
ncbi:MAG: hypothetical protein AAF488_07455 [Planctomycetota bacterium]